MQDIMLLQHDGILYAAVLVQQPPLLVQPSVMVVHGVM
jgi:hypothetical protein